MSGQRFLRLVQRFWRYFGAQLKTNTMAVINKAKGIVWLDAAALQAGTSEEPP